VRPAPEQRPNNATANQTRGVGSTDGHPRVTGNFTGTTDELIQWVACKWGIDEDVVRAQIAKESWWHWDTKGDWTSDQSACHPSLRTTTATCPESFGLGQVRYLYHGAAFANDNALRSSAHNLDYTYSIWRGCYEGQYGWLNTVDRGATYAAGDLWGCLGVWFSGRWYTAPANTYIAAVQQYLADRVWAQPSFAYG
jgi:autotransporter family porin